MHASGGNPIPLGDAVRQSGPLAFNLMVKPVGSACNLGCHYCYYLEKAGLYGGREPVMSEALLERIIKDYSESVDVPELSYVWHGGEPLLAGLAFFRKAVELQRKYSGGRKVVNSIQTNGTLLTDEWSAFFRKNGFLVGLSLDGPRDVHDGFRRDKKGGETFDRVMRGLKILRDHGVEFNTLSTVNCRSEGRGAEIYRFLKDAGSSYMQFLPVLEQAPDGSITPWSVSPRAFGEFMCEVFDEWLLSDVGRVFVTLFDAILASWCGINPGVCAFCQTCGGSPVVEHNGDVYSCDHFVTPECLLGNIRDRSLREMMTSEEQRRFGLSKRTGLPGKCLSCEFLPACGGECPQHRIAGTPALCEGYYHFFTHAAPAMDRMRTLLAQGRAPAEIMNFPKK